MSIFSLFVHQYVHYFPEIHIPSLVIFLLHFMRKMFKEEKLLKHHNLLLVLVIIITFIGGFFTGMYSTNHDSKKIDVLKINDVPKLARNTQQKQKPKIKHKVLMGYVQDFRDPNVVNYSNLTHIIFSFAHPTRDGKLLFNGNSAMKNLQIMVKKAHQHHKKAILAVGGWYHIKGGETYPYFKEALKNPASRSRLVTELIEITNREKLDGIDIDYEYPRTKEDAQNLTIFMNELSKKLRQNQKELSIAVNAKINSFNGTEINNVVYEVAMFKAVDHVNIMAYDGQWDGGYHAENLSPYSFNEKIVNYWTNLFDTHKISRNKLVLGVPFYAQPENPAIKQVSYATIVEKNPANANRDFVQMNGTTYYYNGVKTVQKKTKLAMDHGFGGMMLWEVGHDSLGNDSLTSIISKALETNAVYARK